MSSSVYMRHYITSTPPPLRLLTTPTKPQSIVFGKASVACYCQWHQRWRQSSYEQFPNMSMVGNTNTHFWYLCFELMLTQPLLQLQRISTVCVCVCLYEISIQTHTIPQITNIKISHGNIRNATIDLCLCSKIDWPNFFPDFQLSFVCVVWWRVGVRVKSEQI